MIVVRIYGCTLLQRASSLWRTSRIFEHEDFAGYLQSAGTEIAVCHETLWACREHAQTEDSGIKIHMRMHSLGMCMRYPAP